MIALSDIVDPVARRAARDRWIEDFAAQVSLAELADFEIPFFTTPATLQFKGERRERRAQSIIEGQRAGLAFKPFKKQFQRKRLAVHAPLLGSINLRIRVLNRRNHQLRVCLGGCRDV